MARRWIGDALIYIKYHDEGDYRGSIVVKDGSRKCVWRFAELHAPEIGFGSGIAYDSSEAYDRVAKSAVSFGSYYTSLNRGDDVPDWAPPPDVADAIDYAVGCALNDDGTYEVRRKP